MENDPSKILQAWIALEVLSPATFQRPEELAGGDRAAVVPLDRLPLPWQRNASSKPGYRLYYQVVLGSIRIEPAIAALLERYGDSRAERPAARTNAALAVILIDQQGRVADTPGVGISSFGWGIPVALRGALSELASWSQVEAEIVKSLDAVFRPASNGAAETADLPVVDRALIEKAFDHLVTALGLDPDWLERPSFAVKSFQYFKNSAAPDPLLLNSFFLGDLSLGRDLVERRAAPPNLLRYLGVDRPAKPADLLRDHAALDEAVAPKRTPLARWPANGRHPLVLLQQAAVNLAFANLATDGLVGVNGPPGTGKTTLLRDVVADVVRRRADAMARFDDPEQAFSTTGQRIRAGNGWIHLYALDDTLRGHEIVVASSNNKAVENVSAELPAIDAIAADAERLRYFPALARALHGKDAWGLIAAVLGNGRNRAQFRQTFWWDDDEGLNAYLSTINGASPQVEDCDPVTGQTIRRPPRIVQQENPPADHAQAVRRWKEVTRRYGSRRAEVEEQLAKLEKLRADVREIGELATRVRQIERQLEPLQSQLDSQRAQLNRQTDEEEQAQAALQRADQSRADILFRRPGFLTRWFRLRPARAWHAELDEIESLAAICRSHYSHSSETVRATRFALSEIESARQELVAATTQSRADIAIRQQRLRDALQSGQATCIDDGFHAAPHAARQLSVAWLERDVQLLRDELFIDAMAVHRAFVDAAARRLKHNLGALMNFFSGQSMPDADKEKLRPALWSSLFLVVPVLSTTFASVERMLGRLPPQSLGWLLVDEAGQAPPQAAVGAVIRSQRVVMVGDPVQIEPVVVLPEQLSTAICRTFGVEPERFAAPAASAQTLADSASSHASELETRDGSRMVGLPLLVHRRCAEPMFGISNSVAYAGLMVSAKKPLGCPIGEVLGPSRWIDVAGSGEDKWSEQEGSVVVDLLGRIVRGKCGLDLYIVTPFVIVADRLRQAILDSGLLDRIDGMEPRRWVQDRVGTVHTVQGREAEAVIFVLRAPLSEQRGARAWAGGKPNLLNVAVTRAKEVLYVVGNRSLWQQAGLFSQLSQSLPVGAAHEAVDLLFSRRAD